MATIKQIAEMAGVSRGTVDRVLNNRGSVNPETEARIKAIAKKLNFKPNKAGMALAAQKKRYKIGIILFSKKNPFFDEVMLGMEEKAEELSFYGCEINIMRVAYHPDAQLSAIKALINDGIQGLIITPYNDNTIAAELNKLSSAGIPVVTVNSDIENVHRLCFVGSDYYNSGVVAAGLIKLVTSSQVNLGVIMGDANILCHSERLAGFVNHLSGESRFKLISQNENFDDDAKSYEIVKEMLDKHPEINAFYFTAAGVYGGCRAIIEFKSKHKSNEEIRVITFDDVPTTLEMLDKGIITATICQQPRLQGSTSLDILFHYLNGEETKIKDQYLVELNIKIREILAKSN